LSSSNEERHHRSWTKGSKGRKGEKYGFKVKALRVMEGPFRQDTTEPWQSSADKSEDLRAWIMACEDYFQYNAWQWEQDADRMKSPIRRFKKPLRAQDFGTQYCQGVD
jgi:hypothetical protein